MTDSVETVDDATVWKKWRSTQRLAYDLQEQILRSLLLELDAHLKEESVFNQSPLVRALQQLFELPDIEHPCICKPIGAYEELRDGLDRACKHLVKRRVNETIADAGWTIWSLEDLEWMIPRHYQLLRVLADPLCHCAE